MAAQDVTVTAGPDEVEKQGISPTMDEAAEYLTHNAGFEPLSPEEEKKMIRKMDWILLPMVWSNPTLRRFDDTDFSALHDCYSWCS